MQRVIAIPVVGRSFDDSAQRHPMRAHRLDRRQQRSFRVVEVGAAPARHFGRIRQLFGEYLAERDCAAAFRRLAHPIERGLEAAERERRADAHHYVEARRLRDETRALVLQRSRFDRRDFPRQRDGAPRPRRWDRSQAPSPECRTAWRVGAAANPCRIRHRGCAFRRERRSNASPNPASLRKSDSGSCDIARSLRRIRKGSISLLPFVSELILPQKAVAGVRMRIRGAQQRMTKRSAGIWNDANYLATARRQVRFADFGRKLLTRCDHKTHLLWEESGESSRDLSGLQLHGPGKKRSVAMICGSR